MAIKQYIILRKDPTTQSGNPVTPSKLATMAAHASMAFAMKEIHSSIEHDFPNASIIIDKELKEWAETNYVKVLIGAKTKDFMKIPEKAEKLGLVEGKDFFKIKDICRTELVPDEGQDTCFIAIGFRPMDEKKIKPLVKRLQLY